MRPAEKKILVVDDEAFFREEVADFLRGPRFAEQGWIVETAASGPEALEKLEEDAADVVLLDINMPGMDGMEVLHQLQERHLLDKTYVIMLSAYGVYENVVESMRRGAQDFVNKSEPLDQWIVRIERGFEWQDLQWRKQRAEEELRMLAREVGHDIGGTTYFVLTQRVNALARLVEGNEEGEKAIQIISQILARIKSLADDLGQVAMAWDTRETWHRETLDIHRMLERLLQEFAYGNPQVQIVREWGTDIPPVHGSRPQLERAFLNLLLNAGRAMPEGGTLTVRTRRNGDEWIAVDIADTGVGISPQAQERIFRIGFSDWKNGVKGSGLGLYVSRKNIENHGGHIEVTSKVGEGTVFTVKLPVKSETHEDAD
ncbi:MAG: response regulator [Anaerolineae bacterium]|jgi:signal transduction histidine kinase|nr:response regulator [Anaerolineae bacterium]MDH7474113.1 response regulator [Anaerolineae bacterium]